MIFLPFEGGIGGAANMLIGPFVDATDGFTAETALTIANTDIKLWKSGDLNVTDKNSGGATHVSGGIYSLVLDDVDLNTEGGLKMFVHVAGARPIVLEFHVLAENVYYSLIEKTDNLDVVAIDGTVSVAALGTDAITAAAIAASATNEIATAVWAFATRVLTAGTNIGTVAANVTEWKGTTVPNAHTNGYPIVTIKVGDGTGEIDIQSGAVPAIIAGTFTDGAEAIRNALGMDTNDMDAQLDEIKTALNVKTPNAFADALLDRTDAVETGVTPRKALRAFLAVLCGVATGGNTATITFKNPAGSSTRVVFTGVDGNGNRTTSTLSLG